MSNNADPVRRAAQAIASAEALVVGAGAGMGVDSGLPDFRGTQGFWRAYPVYEKLGLDFAAMANPRWFVQDPELAWGFYGHRLDLYRKTVPHEGFAVLRRLGSRMKHGAWVYTSNVDGQFQKAGFDPDRVTEIHGSIHLVQCAAGCPGIASAEPFHVSLDPDTFRARPPLPACDRCGELLRPNILMFGDGGWDSSRAAAQDAALAGWLEEVDPARAVVVECGAGTAIPSVRMFSEGLQLKGATLVRINVREAQVPPGGVPLPLGALAALRQIEASLSASGPS
jgi:NAD-dependent SIR2 family protein deacetylase